MNGKRKQKFKHEMDDLIESNEYFAFIAGYTENGDPFGITWEQAEELDIIDNLNIYNEDNNLPF
ncbi:hypothetical protein KHQ81_09605 [Mycoplasmatota bacterium]|nr:hypothetical protein KHQ81_09605 [Mycoplasmatota bacterium]